MTFVDSRPVVRLDEPRSSWLVRRLGPAWPLKALLLGFPLWWALGIAQFAFLSAAVAMAVQMYRRGSIRVPAAFGVWAALPGLDGGRRVRALGACAGHDRREQPHPHHPVPVPGHVVSRHHRGRSLSAQHVLADPARDGRGPLARCSVLRLLGAGLGRRTAGPPLPVHLARRAHRPRRESQRHLRTHDAASGISPPAATSLATYSRARRRRSPIRTPGATTSRCTCRSSSWRGPSKKRWRRIGVPSCWRRSSSRSPSRSTAGCGWASSPSPSTPPWRCATFRSTGGARTLHRGRHRRGGIVFVSSPLYDILLRVETPHSNDRRAGTAQRSSRRPPGRARPSLGYGTTRTMQGNFSSLAGGETSVPPVRRPAARHPGLHVAAGAHHRLRRHGSVLSFFALQFLRRARRRDPARSWCCMCLAGVGSVLLRLRLARLGHVHRDDRDRPDGPRTTSPAEEVRARGPARGRHGSSPPSVATLLDGPPAVARSRTSTPSTGTAPGGRTGDAYLFPSERPPALLVPADVPRLSRPCCRRLGQLDGPPAGPARPRAARALGPDSRAFALARWPMLRVRLADRVADSIETHLAARASAPGPGRRACSAPGAVNQKPVLQVFDLAGRLRGYAKVGPQRADRRARAPRGQRARRGRRPRARVVPGPRGAPPRAVGRARGARHLRALRRPAAARSARRRGSPPMREVAPPAGTTRRALAGSAFWARLAPQRRRARRRAAAATARGGCRRRSSGPTAATTVELGRVARRLGPLEHGHRRRGPAGLGLGALRRRRAARLRRPALRCPGCPPGRARGRGDQEEDVPAGRWPARLRRLGVDRSTSTS